MLQPSYDLEHLRVFSQSPLGRVQIVAALGSNRCSATCSHVNLNAKTKKSLLDNNAGFGVALVDHDRKCGVRPRHRGDGANAHPVQLAAADVDGSDGHLA